MSQNTLPYLRASGERTEVVFEDFKPALTGQQAITEANRCLYCYDAPCIKKCPTSIDIPNFIRKLATGNVEGSARTIYASNVLGQSCARVCPVEVLCVGDCVLNTLGLPPIQIGKLQRYATDTAVASKREFFEAGKPTGKKVAIVGSGPASLACAHRLRRFGHAVTLFEKGQLLGGLSTTGIAPYKLRADEALAEVAWVLGIGGIEVKTGVSVPKDVSWDVLLKQYDAVFLGVGLGADSWLEVPGKQLGNVRGAVDFIAELKGQQVDLSKVRHAVVVGGGNTAVDVMRELVGLKTKKVGALETVTMVYRGTEAGMPGYAHEWSHAKEEGAHAAFSTLPVAFEGSTTVTQVRCVKLDANKKPIAGTEHMLPADLVVLGIGQAKLASLVAGLAGVVVKDGCIVTDSKGATGKPGVYAGGDCANGGKEVVNAVAEGRDAAEAMHSFLSGVRNG